VNGPPEISVVIPVANEASALPQCLERISGAPNEVLVIDAASEDATRRWRPSPVAACSVARKDIAPVR
jgi:cellulose synthase/poly-beta-1,6-N-acetylglucosamine synthase-like glycosyltransferase